MKFHPMPEEFNKGVLSSHTVYQGMGVSATTRGFKMKDSLNCWWVC